VEFVKNVKVKRLIFSHELGHPHILSLGGGAPLETGGGARFVMVPLILS